MVGRPFGFIDVEPVGPNDIRGRHLLAGFAREGMARHRRQPDVGVEADLVGGMAGEHRSAARLRHVADEDARPVRDRRHLLRETLEEGDERRIAPVAVARQAHHLPGLAIDRQRLAAGETAARIEADRPRREIGGRKRAAEQFLGGRGGIVRIGERRQRLWIHRAAILRGCAGDRSQQCARRDQATQHPSLRNRERRQRIRHALSTTLLKDVTGRCLPAGIRFAIFLLRRSGGVAL